MLCCILPATIPVETANVHKKNLEIYHVFAWNIPAQRSSNPALVVLAEVIVYMARTVAILFSPRPML